MFSCQIGFAFAPPLSYLLDQGEFADGILLHNDLSEPTIGEELAGLGMLFDNKFRSDKEQDSSFAAKPPSADSVHVLLTRASIEC